MDNNVVEVPQWLKDLMDLFDLDIVERARFVRKWNAGFVSKDRLSEELSSQVTAKEIGFDTISGMISERELLQGKAQEMGIGFIDLERIDPDPLAISAVSGELVTQTQAIPVKKVGATMWVAISNSHDIKTLSAFKQATGCRVIPGLATKESISQAIASYYSQEDKP